MLDRDSGGDMPRDGTIIADRADTSAAPMPAVPALLTALRAGTRAAHARLEAMPGMARLLAPDLTHTQYVSALRGFHEFHAGMRRALAPFTAAFLPFDMAENLALEALDADLAWYHAAPAQRQVRMRAVPDAAAALGALYVLEGSALGGRVIGRALTESLGVSPGFGGSFFCGVTAEAARRRWLDFTALLVRAQSWLDAAGTARAVDAACSAFGCFERLAVPDGAGRDRAAQSQARIHPAKSGPASPAPASLGFAAQAIS